MLVVRTFLFLDFCEVVLKVACAQGFLFTVWVWDVIIALSRPVCCWIGMFRGVVQYYIHVVLSKFPLGGGGIFHIHDVEVLLCTFPPMNNLGSLYAVLLVFSFYGVIYIPYDGVVGWYLFLSISIPLMVLVLLVHNIIL